MKVWFLCGQDGGDGCKNGSCGTGESQGGDSDQGDGDPINPSGGE